MSAWPEPGVLTGRRLPVAPVVGCVLSGAAVIAAYVLERGNGALTLNFRQSTDTLVVAVMFAVGVVGAVVLLLRPRHVTGRLMLCSGICWGLALLAHAVAVRLLLVQPRTDGFEAAAGQVAAWVAGFGFVPAFGLLVFVPATWPAGWVTGAALRRLTWATAAALVLLTVAQALAPDRLDAVAGSAPGNPLGVAALDAAVAVVTPAAGVVLAAFAAVSLADLVRRGLRARGDERQAYVPVLIALGAAVLSGLVVLPWWGGELGAFVGAAVALGGTALAVGVGAAALRRVERAERARARLVAEREVERAVLRRDLHDGIGPLLAALRLEVDAMAAGGFEPVRARALLADALAEIRRLSRDLRPVALDELGLVGALRQQADVLSGPGGLVISMTLPDEVMNLPPAVEVAVVRICGEALTNVVRHAHAASASVQLHVGDCVRLRIRDDGVGMPARVTHGVGLWSMVERAEELGGSCEIQRAPGGGTLVSIRLPRQR